MRAIERQRKSLALEQEVAAKRRELEDIERKISDDRMSDSENANPNERQ